MVRELLEVQGVCDYVLLVGREAVEVVSIEPIHILGVVGVSPQRVCDVVRSNGEIGVVTDEAAAELVASIDRRSGCHLCRAAQLAHYVVQFAVVDVRAGNEAINAAVWIVFSARLPR